MKFARSIVLAVAALAFAASAAYADTPKKSKKDGASTGSSAPSSALDVDQEKAFRLLDLDGDGAISKAEAAGNAALITAFDRADRDHDGKLSRAEYAAIGKLQARKGAKAAAK